MTEVRSANEVATVYQNAKKQNIPVFILGSGSNVIVRDDGYNGIVVHMRIPGFEVLSDDISSTVIKIGAGEEWDPIVERTVNMGLSGIEAMSFIPGTAGAAPVQNVGAYGQEIADTLISLEAYDSQADKFVTLSKDQCGFSYRNSTFKGKDAGRYAITSITIKLSKNQPQPPFYESLQKYLEDNNITIYTNKVIRDAVIEIRKNKLPDPSVLPNTGSFFKNAMVEKWQLDDLVSKYNDIPYYDMGNNTFKIPSGWLIEKVGLKGSLINGMRVYDKNALVLVNESAKSYADLATARETVIGKVRDTFRIQIQQEPIEI